MAAQLLFGVKPTGLARDGAIALQTRMRSDIENAISWMQPDDGARMQVKDYSLQYPNARHRPVGPCMTYNCHGLTFASRRTVVWTPAEVDKILRDDGYAQVDWKQVEAGDIAIYRMSAAAGGDISHSGIVVEPPNLNNGLFTMPKILSKIGHLHEAIHQPHECDYAKDATVEYYRISK